MPERWCTVSVTDAEGRQHSVDVFASSTFDAAHLYLTHVKGQPNAQIPIPTRDTVFEVVIGGKIYIVKGTALKEWIAERRTALKGPKGMLFSRRPTLG
jgi:hypothetical protein